ncbi:MAG: hypothetical protein HRT45_19195 [Bdellovibrionales bacterium]|nr:hypothetical protein [Bdellovibrionales bacterium]
MWLGSLTNHSEAKTILYKAYIHIMQWQYKQSLVYLNEYINRSDISPYERLIAQTNVAAAHIFEGEYESADKVLKLLRGKTLQGGHSLLFSNAYELSAQVQLAFGENKSAQEFLDKGFSIAKGGSSAHLYLEKEQALLKAETSGAEEAIRLLQAVRAKAVDQGVWETIRECDFYTAKFSENEKLLHCVLIGTPHESYRQRLIRSLKANFELKGSVQFSLPRGNVKASTLLHLSDLRLSNTAKPIEKIGSLFHRTLLTLCSDFYRPFRIGTLFSELYPNEHYDPLHSPDRVHQVIRRVRKHLMKYNLEIGIKQKLGLYRLTTPPGLQFVKDLKDHEQTHDSNLVQKLKHHFGQESFSLKQAQALLQVSQSKTYYLIKPLVDQQLEKISQGPKTRYKFTALLK